MSFVPPGSTWHGSSSPPSADVAKIGDVWLDLDGVLRWFVNAEPCPACHRVGDPVWDEVPGGLSALLEEEGFGS